jgi:hypothetical protein
VRSDAEDPARERRLFDVPGAALLGIWPFIAAAALAFNVFYLRRHHRGFISGKLSDVAINFLLPIFLVSAAEWLLALLRLVGARVEPRVGLRGIWIACLASALYFTLLKAWPPFTAVHRALLTHLDALLGGGRSFRNLADPTDLVALVTVPLSALYLRRAALRRAV